MADLKLIAKNVIKLQKNFAIRDSHFWVEEAVCSICADNLNLFVNSEGRAVHLPVCGKFEKYGWDW